MHVLLLLWLLLLCTQLPLLPRLALLEAPSLTGALTRSPQEVCCCVDLVIAPSYRNLDRSPGPQRADEVWQPIQLGAASYWYACTCS
jgi:hypothetical protein